MRVPAIDKLSLGYSFGKDREIVSLIYINYFIIFLFTGIVILLHSNDEVHALITFRYHTIILIGFIELYLIRKHLITLARILILTLTPFLILILPPLGGIFSDEFYFWFPYVPIAISLIPHFILHTSRDRIALIATLAIYFLLTLLIDNYLIYLSDGSELIIPFVMENRFYYNLIPLVIYVFVNLAIGLVFANNFRLEEILTRQQDELVHAEKMASLGIITTGIAHEINNPLNFISGSLHALGTLKNELVQLEEKISPEKKQLLDQIEKIIESSFEGVQRASGIVTSLKFFANPVKEKKTRHDLEQILYPVLLSIEKRIPYNVSLQKNIPAGLQVYCFEEQLQKVIKNILKNAIDAIEGMEVKRPRKIYISATETNGTHTPVTRISIGNNGPPIAEKDIKRIFDPFFTRKDPGKGTGLGMAISYMIVREHGGRIEVRNKDGVVAFDVILPLH